MARNVDEMMVDKTEDKLQVYIAQARVDQLETELLEARAALDPLQETATMLRRQRDHWQRIAEKEHWPFEWQVATRLKKERDDARRHACRLLWERDEARGELGAIQQLAEDAVNTESWLLGMRLRQRLLAFTERQDVNTYDPHEVASLGYEVDRGGDGD